MAPQAYNDAALAVMSRRGVVDGVCDLHKVINDFCGEGFVRSSAMDSKTFIRVPILDAGRLHQFFCLVLAGTAPVTLPSAGVHISLATVSRCWGRPLPPVFGKRDNLFSHSKPGGKRRQTKTI